MSRSVVHGSVETAKMKMSVILLKEVLDDLNITYRANTKKAVLIAKVKGARMMLNAHAS